ncbi:hypothetical protein HDU99_004222, partial [Rhizoclosmatium hyalinum]
MVRRKKTAAKTRVRSGDSEEEDRKDEVAKVAPSSVSAAKVSFSFDGGDGGNTNDTDMDTNDNNSDAATLKLLEAKAKRRKLKQQKAAMAFASTPSSTLAPTATSTSTTTTDNDNPYSAENLRKLKMLQRSLPQRDAALISDDQDAMVLDQSLEDVNQLRAQSDTRIYDSAEIHALRKLKEEKRLRLERAAKSGGGDEEDDDGGNEDDFVGLDGKSKKHESRLVTEDQEEDEAEPFEAHQGTRIQFGNKSADQLKAERKKAIQLHLID